MICSLLTCASKGALPQHTPSVSRQSSTRPSGWIINPNAPCPISGHTNPIQRSPICRIRVLWQSTAIILVFNHVTWMRLFLCVYSCRSDDVIRGGRVMNWELSAGLGQQFPYVDILKLGRIHKRKARNKSERLFVVSLLSEPQFCSFCLKARIFSSTKFRLLMHSLDVL